MFSILIRSIVDGKLLINCKIDGDATRKVKNLRNYGKFSANSKIDNDIKFEYALTYPRLINVFHSDIVGERRFLPEYQTVSLSRTQSDFEGRGAHCNLRIIRI